MGGSCGRRLSTRRACGTPALRNISGPPGRLFPLHPAGRGLHDHGRVSGI